MDISSTPVFNTAKSIEEMNNLLKNMTSQAMGLQDKLMKAEITEKVSTPGLGENLDISA